MKWNKGFPGTAPEDGTQILVYGKWKPYDILPGGEDCFILASFASLSAAPAVSGEWLISSSMLPLNNYNVDFSQWAFLEGPKVDDESS